MNAAPNTDTKYATAEPLMALKERTEVLDQIRIPELCLDLVRLRKYMADEEGNFVKTQKTETYQIHLVDGRRGVMEQLFNLENKRKRINHSSRTDCLKHNFEVYSEMLWWIAGKYDFPPDRSY